MHCFGCSVLAILCLSIPVAPAVAAESLKAFPTAEGFGANAVGGRGGRVIEVTNLDDSGEGSLRSAMETSGPRIVVFRVSGTITLQKAIRVSTPYLTVAGQTSPGGVQVRGNGQPEGDWGVWFVDGAHVIVVRHLRLRMGGNMKHDEGKPFAAPAVTLDPVAKLLDKVLGTVGACKPSRDAIDQRIVRSVHDKTGSSRISTTGPWPDLAPGAPAPPVDSDHDGMPDVWEKAYGLDPNNARDGAAAAANGYTNLENYLNELAGDAIPATDKATAPAPLR